MNPVGLSWWVHNHQISMIQEGGKNFSTFGFVSNLEFSSGTETY